MVRSSLSFTRCGTDCFVLGRRCDRYSARTDAHYRQECNSELRDSQLEDPWIQHPMENDPVYNRPRLRPSLRRWDKPSLVQRREWQSHHNARQSCSDLANGERRMEVRRRHLERWPRPEVTSIFLLEV